MLRPPAHSQQFLASAQGRRFGSDKGQRDGWVRVMTSLQAQHLANAGELVVLVYVNPDYHVPGHIAIVRPYLKSMAALDHDGPETMQAGAHNFADGNAVRSFTKHPGAWPTQVAIYAHTIDFSAPPPPPAKDDDVDDDGDEPAPK